MSYLSPTLSILVNAVKKATASLDRDFSEIEKLQSSVRSYQDFIARSYDKVAQALRYELSRIKPDAVFCENGMPADKGTSFLVNPIDGSVNFIKGFACFATTVAYCENGEVKISLIYNRATDEMYFAERGNGAYKEGCRNHERLRVSACKEPEQAIVAVSAPADKTAEVFAKAKNVRILGCVSLELANVAAGKFDICLNLQSNSNSLTAGLLLVKEAGGYIYNLDKKSLGNDKLELVLVSDNIIAANNSIVALVKQLAE